MKKYNIFFVIGIILSVTLLPFFLVDKIKIIEDKVEDKKEDKKEKINTEKDVKKYVEEEKSGQTIRVRHTKTGEVVAMDVNDYLRGVLPSEMPPSFELEALKAQAVVARTYLYNKIEGNINGQIHKDADICDDFAHCQAYHPKEKIIEIWKGRGFTESQIQEYKDKVNRAVNETTDVVIKYNNKYIKAFFHANSGGMTEDCKSIWNKEDIPYLKAVASLGEEDHKYYKTQNKFTKQEVEKIIREKIDSNYTYQKDIEIIEYTDSKRASKVKIGNNILEGTKVREIFNLKSTNFNIILSDDIVEFNVTGYGHGVGMSQTGANYYAKQGKTYEEIIKHYYQGVDVIKNK